MPFGAEIFLFFSPAQDTFAFVSYDPSSGIWTRKPDMHASYNGYHEQWAISDSSIFLSREGNAELAQYRPSDGHWDKVALTEWRYDWSDMSLFEYEGQVFAAGGRDGRLVSIWDTPDAVSWMQAYNPHDGSWVPQTDIRHPGHGFVCLTLEDGVYFFGGSTGSVQVYRPRLEER